MGNLAKASALSVGLFAGASPHIAFAQNGSYALRAGDVLSLEVLEDPGLNRSLLVAPDGRVNIPLAGSVQAQGRTVDQVQAEITSRLAPNFAVTPSVTVSIESVFTAPPVPPTPPAPPPTIDVFFMGETANPGRAELEPGTTLLQALAEVGGFSPFAATQRIQLRRTDPVTGQETIYSINYDAIERGDSPNARVTLLDGDVILVPQRQLFE